mmetsp:Transcript_22010/g.46427  ORF Transcript_22010/g.46427 Transcript_22010/m.46427 type:complete len:173 (-) Transcript_22010:46-564(-)|eukprot:CAMPEP_0183725008 /NCGR_PEP_ID=MMETSP0737-20130205/19421_1 /TAXON_ID=385413 /ORGANISM="Thalassiosira miniscula, Strain CCMP1093" /LENGTH=172 /DNA_ID=CAMNT_0025955809 /DNA_START=26 /DNA_END=544 /DNA_ORIENTATION=+
MAKFSTVLASIALLLSGVSALAPSKVPKATKPAFNVQKVALNGMAAASIASALVIGPMADAVDMMADTPSFGSSSLVAERVTREGLYREYEVDLGDQIYDDASSTYKSAKETKSKKGKYTALIAVLVVGSFIIPMAQYFWYVRDDDSSDKFFSKADIPEPEPEPVKKKGWFN